MSILFFRMLCGPIKCNESNNRNCGCGCKYDFEISQVVARFAGENSKDVGVQSYPKIPRRILHYKHYLLREKIVLALMDSADSHLEIRRIDADERNFVSFFRHWKG